MGTVPLHWHAIWVEWHSGYLSEPYGSGTMGIIRFCLCLLNDIVVHRTTWSEYLEHVGEILDRLRPDGQHFEVCLCQNRDYVSGLCDWERSNQAPDSESPSHPVLSTSSDKSPAEIFYRNVRLVQKIYSQLLKLCCSPYRDDSINEPQPASMDGKEGSMLFLTSCQHLV